MKDHKFELLIYFFITALLIFIFFYTLPFFNLYMNQDFNKIQFEKNKQQIYIKKCLENEGIPVIEYQQYERLKNCIKL